MVVIGGISALLGTVVLFSALSSGSISLSYLHEGGTVAKTVTRDGDFNGFVQYAIMLGLAPAVLGAAAAVWGMRALRG
jgi:hypothetical protein